MTAPIIEPPEPPDLPPGEPVVHADEEEDHEELAGEAMQDPWEDDAQTDWPNN